MTHEPIFDCAWDDPAYEDTPVFTVGAIGRIACGTRFLVLNKGEHCARPGELFAIVSRGEHTSDRVVVGNVVHYSFVLAIDYETEPPTHEPITWESNT